MYEKRGWIWIFIVIIILFLIGALYFSFFYYYSCSDLACYRSHQEKCVKTKFVNEQIDSIWAYKIQGKSSGNCRIDVTLKSLKEGSSDKEVLEGKTMSCYLPLKSSSNPEADLSLCHGALKEEMQNQIIQKLHKYILANVGQINEELEKGI